MKRYGFAGRFWLRLVGAILFLLMAAMKTAAFVFGGKEEIWTAMDAYMESFR